MSDVARQYRVGIELGGTWCRCIAGTGPEGILAEEDVPTRDPASTLAALAALLQRWRGTLGEPAALGLASFGPLQLRRDSPRYGCLGATPKSGWPGVDLRAFFAQRVAAPLAITTDVIAAALAEGRWGAARGLDDYAYVTVGTGIGVGLVVNRQAVVGGHHPELGHVRIARLPDDAWPGLCPFHGDCVEGLASGPAIQARTGRAAVDIGADDPVWDAVAHALAQLAQVTLLAAGPRRIVMGGGVMRGQPHLVPRIRRGLERSLAGYLDLDDLSGGVERLIVPPALGERAGRLGALTVAAEAQSASVVRG